VTDRPIEERILQLALAFMSPESELLEKIVPESFINSTGTLGFGQHPTVLDWGIIWGEYITSFGGSALVLTVNA
jgi:hypothetical protein